MVKISPSNAGGVGSISSWGTKIPHASGPKKKKNQNLNNRSNMVTNSTKIFKMVHIRFLLIYGRNQHNIVKHLKLKVAQLCLTLCDPMDYTVHGILQARILEWVALPFSRGSSQPRDRTQVSHIAGGFFTS